jgi:hypothetical protein
VISVVGDTFSRRYLGLLVFGNESDDRDVTSWKLDRIYEEQLGNSATTIFGATYVSGPYSRESFATINDVRGQLVGGSDWSKIEQPAKDYCRANGLDALLVVAKGHSTPLGTRAEPQSMGIHARLTWAVLYVSAQVAMIDCATGRPRKIVLLTPNEGDFSGSYVATSLPREMGAVPVTAWDGKQEAEMKESMVKLPAPAWTITLKRMMQLPPQPRPTVNP